MPLILSLLIAVYSAIVLAETTDLQVFFDNEGEDCPRHYFKYQRVCFHEDTDFELVAEASEFRMNLKDGNMIFKRAAYQVNFTLYGFLDSHLDKTAIPSIPLKLSPVHSALGVLTENGDGNFSSFPSRLISKTTDENGKITVEFLDLENTESLDIVLRSVEIMNYNTLFIYRTEEGIRRLSPSSLDDLSNVNSDEYEDLDMAYKFVDNFEITNDEYRGRLSDNEIRRYFVPGYKLVRKLGNGGYGVVYLGIQESTGKYVAIKFNLLDLKSDERPFETSAEKARRIEEISITKMVEKMPFVIKFLKIVGGFYRNVLVMELAESDLFDLIDNTYQRGLPLKLVKEYSFVLLIALAEMHEKKIVHADFRPENILIVNGLPKITDFGLAKVLSDTENIPPFQVPSYRAPEAWLNWENIGEPIKLNEKIDIWSAGVTIGVLLTGGNMFSAEIDSDVPWQIMKVLGQPTQNFPFSNYFFKMGTASSQDKLESTFGNTIAADLLKKMFAWNSNERISAVQALKHEFFDDIRDQFREINPSLNRFFERNSVRFTRGRFTVTRQAAQN